MRGVMRRDGVRQMYGRGASRPREGFALLAALWLIVMITTVALEFSLESRARRETAINISERGQALAAASAGLETAQSRLDAIFTQATNGTGSGSTYISSADPWQHADSLLSDSASLGGPSGPSYRVVVRDGGSVLNINTMTEDGWRGLFLAFHIDYSVANGLAEAIMDWRDPDDNPREQGAERPQYIGAGRVVLPTNHNFTSVSQLRDVIGMTPQIYALIAPYLSVGTSGRVSINNADLPVLETLPGFTDDVVSAILAVRYNGGRFQSMTDLARQVGGAAQSLLVSSASQYSNQVTFTTREIFVTSTGWSPGGQTSVTSQAVFRSAVRNGYSGMQLVWRQDS